MVGKEWLSRQEDGGQPDAVLRNGRGRQMRGKSEAAWSREGPTSPHTLPLQAPGM